MSIQKPYKSIDEYLGKYELQRSEMIEYILMNALEIGCCCSNMAEEKNFDMQTVFMTLNHFYEILDTVE